MSRLEKEVVRNAEELVQALAAAREELRKTEQMIRRGLKRFEREGDILSVVLASPPAESRKAVQDALNEVNRCRHRARLTVFSLALEAGVSIGELSRAWGISRQLASRYAKEATKP